MQNLRDTKQRRQAAGQINFELAQGLAADGNRGLTNLVEQELRECQMQEPAADYEAIMAEV